MKTRKPKKLIEAEQGLALANDRILEFTRKCDQLQSSLYRVKIEREAQYQKEYARRETLAALVGKFKQNVAEFTRVFESVMEK